MKLKSIIMKFSLFICIYILIGLSSFVYKHEYLEDNDFLPSYGQIVHHKYYSLSYNEEHEQANWVAYTLNTEMLIKNVSRINYFKKDVLIKTKSVNTKEYSNSGYDRGHLCPAADMYFSDQAMRETFLTSNISPQHPSFNRGIWKALETKVRNWVKLNEELHIVTAGVLEDGLMKIGKNEKISIPKRYYKVILDYKEPELKAIGFIMKNQKSELGIMDFAVSIDSIEALTGIDFFSSLPDDVEEFLESKINLQYWD